MVHDYMYWVHAFVIAFFVYQLIGDHSAEWELCLFLSQFEFRIAIISASCLLDRRTAAVVCVSLALR